MCVDYYNKGVAFFDAGSFEEAIACFEKYLLHNPEEPTTYDNIGLCYASMEEYRKAIPYFEKALSLYPLVEACQNLAYVYKKLGDEEKSQEYVHKMLLLEKHALGKVKFVE